MISTTQAEALKLLAELCQLSPDVRLGQLLAHLGFLGEDQTGRSLWDIDDDQLLAVMQHHHGELMRRLEDTPDRPDGLVDDLLTSNTAFKELVAKSTASPRKPFAKQDGSGAG
jgi:hypothetical protein